MPIAAQINGRLYAIDSDHLNTPRRLTNAQGQVVWQWLITGYGEVAPTTGATGYAFEAPQLGGSSNTSGNVYSEEVNFKLRYPGQVWDEETGLSYNLNRYYDAQAGRYVQADPIGLDGGWNRYAYVEGNPLLLIDPEGLAGKGYIYKKGGVHHQLPNAVARDMDWSPAAVKEFDASGFNPPLNKKPHFKEGDLTHQQYNKDVAKFCEDWTQKNKVDPTQATPEQARQLMYDLRYNAPKSIMDFNRAIWMRSMLSNIWWYRPTE
jgi:RHS repeat-associated protein